MIDRRGFTLVEAMIALVVGSLLAALGFDTVVRVHRLARERAERAGLESTLRNAVLPIARELQSAGTDSIGGMDVGGLPGSSMVIRAERGLWSVCALALPDTLVVAEPGSAGWSLRAPVPGRDSLLLYAAGDSTAAVDAWLPLPLTQGPFAGTCPGGGPGWRWVSALDTATARVRRIAVPSVVRTFELLGYRLYGSGGTWQIGEEGLSAGAIIQPVAGPLSPAGLDFVGFDRAMIAASAPSVVTVRIRAVGLSHRQAAVGPGIAAGVVDSLEWLVRLRNVP